MDEMHNERHDMDREILFSRSVKAGKRLYYIDIKRSRRGDMLLSITESKKIYDEQHPDALPTYEKHKVFIYQEDFDKMSEAISAAMDFARKERPAVVPHPTEIDPETLETDLVQDTSVVDDGDGDDFKIEF